MNAQIDGGLSLRKVITWYEQAPSLMCGFNHYFFFFCLRTTYHQHVEHLSPRPEKGQARGGFLAAGDCTPNNFSWQIQRAAPLSEGQMAKERKLQHAGDTEFDYQSNSIPQWGVYWKQDMKGKNRLSIRSIKCNRLVQLHLPNCLLGNGQD